MPFKITTFFVSDKYSWTEVHWSNMSGQPSAIQPNVLELMLARAPCLGIGAAVKLARISNLPANSAVYDVIPSQPIAPTWPTATPAGIFNASRPYQALQVRMSSIVGLHRNYYMGGAPAGLFHGGIPGDSGLDFSQVGDFSARLAAWLNLLSALVGQTSQWGWLTRTFAIATQAVAPLVTNVAFPGMVGVQLTAPMVGLAMNSQVVAKGWRRTSVKAGSRLSGVYRVGGILQAGGTVPYFTVFLQNTPNVVPTNFFTTGSLAPYVPQIAGYFGAQSVQATERKRGATAYRPRGRSRTR